MNRLLEKRYVRFLLVFAAAAVLIAARRPQQTLRPEVWNEDGLFVIPQIVQHGFAAVVWPVNGYLIVPSRLVTWISLHISFVDYPLVSTILGVLVQALCVALVAVAPTQLPPRTLCALALIFLPMNAEVYALPQYTFWWTTILLILSLVWQPGQKPVMRSIFAAIGAFSSPFVITLVPVFAVRLVSGDRRREEIVPMTIVTVISLIQIYFILAGDPTTLQTIRFGEIYFIIERFFGGFNIMNRTPVEFLAGCLVFLLLAAGLFLVRRQARLPYFLLGAVVAAAIMSAIFRVPAEIIAPTGDGPRYFFLPLVAMSWMLIWLALSTNWLARLPAIVVIAACLPVTWSHFQRWQEPLEPWGAAARRCVVSGANMPVQYDGLRATQESRYYSSQTCQTANSDALF